MDNARSGEDAVRAVSESGPYLTLTRSMLGDDVCVGVRGEVDISAAPELGAYLAAICSERPPGLAVNFDEVTFFDSSGVRVLVHAARVAAAAGIGFYLLCPVSNLPVRRVIDILQLNTVLTIVDS